MSRHSVYLSAFTLAGIALALACGACDAAMKIDSVQEKPTVQHGLIKPGPLFRGQSDTSAVIFLDADTCLFGSDEENTLQLYRLSRGTMPARSFDLSHFLKPHKKGREVDIEGCARIGDMVYWIGSHATNRDGKARPTRRRLFATLVTKKDDTWSVKQMGIPFAKLIEALGHDDRFAKYDFEKAAKIQVKKPGSLNIEGLAATPDGGLLIGFRSPLANGKALLVKILNPKEVVLEKAVRFADPIELDLKGLGIRSLEYLPIRKEYILIAGPAGSGRQFALYLWSGATDQNPRILCRLSSSQFHPEAITPVPGTGDNRLLMVNDDGTRLIGGVENKALPAPKRSSRSYWIDLDPKK